MTTFSQRLQKLLSSPGPLTLDRLIRDFAEKSFALLFLLLLALSALPLPTGGVTHVFEIIAMLLALESVAGLKTIWLPKRWSSKPLPKGLQTTALPKFIRIINWFEKLSRPRLSKLLRKRVAIRVISALIFCFTLFAFIAPPFSGLDTLPSLAVVILSLSLIFEDFVLLLVGVVVGFAGVVLILALGDIALKLI